MGQRRPAASPAFPADAAVDGPARDLRPAVTMEPMTTGAWIAVAVLLAATAFGLWRRRTDGHFRGETAPEPPPADQTHLPSADRSDWGEDDHNPHDLVRTRLEGADLSLQAALIECLEGVPVQAGQMTDVADRQYPQQAFEPNP